MARMPLAMRTQPHADALTAAQFFKRDLDGFSKTAAMRATGLSYSAVHDTTDDAKTPRVDTMLRLQEWSLAAIAEHGCYISAAKTLGVSEPGPAAIAKAAGE